MPEPRSIPSWGLPILVGSVDIASGRDQNLDACKMVGVASDGGMMQRCPEVILVLSVFATTIGSAFPYQKKADCLVSRFGGEMLRIESFRIGQDLCSAL